MRNILAALLLCALSIPAIADDATDACFNFLDAQDYPRAVSQAQSILKRDKASRNAWLCLGRTYSKTGDLKNALPALKEVEALSTSTKELAVAYNWLGEVYRKMGDLGNAEMYNNRALKLARELGNKAGEATALSNLALIFKSKGDADRALEYYRKSLDLTDKDEDRATTWNNMAAIYYAKGDYPQAIEFFQQALEVMRRAGNYQELVYCQINLGATCRKIRDYAQAEKLLAEGLEGARRVGDRYWEAVAYQNQGMLKVDQGDIPAARALMVQAMKLYESLGAKEDATAIRNSLEGAGK